MRHVFVETNWVFEFCAPAYRSTLEAHVLVERAAKGDLVLHDLQFKEGGPQQTLFMFAEAVVVCMTMEHFVRIVLGSTAPAEATLGPLLVSTLDRRHAVPCTGKTYGSRAPQHNRSGRSLRAG